MTRPRHAVVLGSGVGGLAAGVALHQQGWEVTVLERDARLSPVGAGIAVAPNGLRALDVLGLGDEVRATASVQGPGGYRTPQGRWLLRMDLSAAQATLGDVVVVLTRRTLVDVLAAALPAGALRTGARGTLVRPGSRPRPAVVRVEGDGGAGRETLEADLVVAADGAGSATRAALFPGHPGLRYAGYTAWRMLPDLGPDPAPVEPFETWGAGERFSALPMAGGQVYCWATATVAARSSAPDERAELLRRFGGWHEPVPTLLRATPADAVLRHDAVELAAPLPGLHLGRTALLGDAAHPMTPDLGQGGCQSLEDAVVLAHAVRGLAGASGAAAGADGTSATDVTEALAAYTAARLPRTTAIARLSRRVARVGQARSPGVVRLRTLGLRAAAVVPPAATLRGAQPVLGWRPPR